ncbi:hypothetical protein MKL29_08215 [Streptococcus suis]|nr:hypothetical protein [Streptococcus suis]
MKTPQRFFCLGCFSFKIKVNRGYDIGSVDALAAISNDTNQFILGKLCQITLRLPQPNCSSTNWTSELRPTANAYPLSRCGAYNQQKISL